MDINLDSVASFSQVLNFVGKRFNKFFDDDSPDMECLTPREIENQFRSSTLLQKIIKKYPEAAKAIGYELIDKMGR